MQSTGLKASAGVTLAGEQLQGRNNDTMKCDSVRPCAQIVAESWLFVYRIPANCNVSQHDFFTVVQFHLMRSARKETSMHLPC